MFAARVCHACVVCCDTTLCVTVGVCISAGWIFNEMNMHVGGTVSLHRCSTCALQSKSSRFKSLQGITMWSLHVLPVLASVSVNLRTLIQPCCDCGVLHSSGIRA